MHSQGTTNALIAGCFVLFFSLVAVPAARADIFYDVAIKGAYEDNVVGLLSDRRSGTASTPAAGGPGMMSAVMGPGGQGGMGGPGGAGGNTLQDTGVQSKSDSLINLFADIGGSAEIASGAYAFLIGSAQRTSYNSFNEFNATIGGVSAGIDKKLGDSVTVRFAVNGSIKRYGDSVRDSSALGPAVILKEQFTPSFWLKESYSREKNNADSSLFTYTGDSIGIWAGYLVLPKTTLLLGYNHLVRDYNEPSDFKMTANTASVGLGYEFLEKWFLDAQYDHQASDSNVAGTNTTDNIYSLGLRYSY